MLRKLFLNYQIIDVYNKDSKSTKKHCDWLLMSMIQISTTLLELSFFSKTIVIPSVLYETPSLLAAQASAMLIWKVHNIDIKFKV
jgi:hypothetical protein